MAKHGFGRVQKATVLLPLALLSVAWTASLVTAGHGSPTTGPGVLPDGTRVPADAVQAPASLTAPRTTGAAPRGPSSGVVTTASASGIPAVALAAYQRAATVIDAADTTCHLPWQLVAAIGRVESDHGRSGGSVLSRTGIARPGIYGPALDGTHGTILVRDTDAGQYDHDTRDDRAVGPMQFIPSTWAIVGVDADNDGRRDPQDIYDAALGSAVYLCSGPDDLGTDAGQTSAVLRYNHDQGYADLVLSIMHSYLAGDFSAVPGGDSTVLSLAGPQPGGTPPTRAPHHDGPHPPGHQPPQPTSAPSASPTAGAPSGHPTGGPSSEPTKGSTKGPSSSPSGAHPTRLPLPSVPTLVPSDAPTVLTRVQAVVQCLADGLVDNPLDPADAFDRCVYRLTH